jgi:hypothetical protein
MICLWNKVDFHSRPEAEAFDAMICFEEADLIHAERLGLTERGDDENPICIEFILFYIHYLV